MHCIIQLFWFLYNHVMSPAEGLHFSALVCSAIYNYTHLDSDNYQNNNYPLMIASQGSLATDSAVLKLSGKVFDKPFKGPVSLHTIHGHNALLY